MHNKNIISACASKDSAIRLYDLSYHGQCTKVLSGHIDWVTVLECNHDKTKLASGSYDNTIRIFDIELGKCEIILRGHFFKIISMAFSHDGKRLASASIDDSIYVWNLCSKSCERILVGHSHFVYNLIFIKCDNNDVKTNNHNNNNNKYNNNNNNRNNEMLISDSKDGTIRFWNVEKDSCQAIYQQNDSFLIDNNNNKSNNNIINGTCYDAQNEILASCTSENKIILWQINKHRDWENEQQELEELFGDIKNAAKVS
jgi:WD40 repeat protein